MDQPQLVDPHTEIRLEVAKLCARFPGEYWRKLDQERAYPTEFVRALTEGGYLGALIPEEYGGAGLPLSERGRAEAKAAAMTEVEHLAHMIEQAPLGVQIGLLQEPEPSHQAIIYRARDRAHVIANPFAVDAHPGWSIGIASVTSADDALAIHQRVAEACWRQARKGLAAAQRLRILIAEAHSA